MAGNNDNAYSRFSSLYGTDIKGNYSPIGQSEGLSQFLLDHKAPSPASAIVKVRNILAGFPQIASSAQDFRLNYDSQPVDDRPVAVRYAPMHLARLEDMPSDMVPFCALSVSGMENKDNEKDVRITTYSHIYFFSRENMHNAVAVFDGEKERTITYLDQIFGSHLLNYEELALIRKGIVNADYDALPQKVTPRILDKDVSIMMHTIDAIYNEKTVVIRLEKGCAFNRRAWEVLTPIYSMLPPRFATEVGFATYLDPKEIEPLSNKTSIRIFVIPGECSVSALSGKNILVLDLNNRESIPHVSASDLTKTISRWATRFTWEQRQQAMEAIFADTATSYNDRNVYIERSAAFFADPFFAWEKNKTQSGTIHNLDELQAEYEKYPLCAQIPWMKELFVRRIPRLLGDKKAFRKLSAEALANAAFSRDADVRKKAERSYVFAEGLGGTTAIAAAQSAGSFVKNQAELDFEEERKKAQISLEQTREDCERALADVKTQANAAIVAERAKTAAAIEDGKAAVEEERSRTAKAVEDGKAAVEEERSRTAKAVEDGKNALIEERARTVRAIEDGRRALDEERQRSAQAIAAEKDNSSRAVAAEVEKYEMLKEKASERIREEKEKSAGLQYQLDSEIRAHTVTKGTLEECRNHVASMETEAERTDGELAFQRKRNAALTHEKEEIQQELDDVRQQIDAANALKEEAQKVRAQAEHAKKKAERVVHRDKMRDLIFAGIGFAAAALIFGTVLLIVTLVGGKQVPNEADSTVPSSVATVPSETTLPATEPSSEATETTETLTEPTEEPTEPEVTLQETVEKPTPFSFNDTNAAAWIKQNYPGVKSVVTDDFAFLGSAMADVEEAEPVAVLLFDEQDENLEAVCENTVVVFRKVTSEQEETEAETDLSVEGEPADSEIPEQPRMDELVAGAIDSENVRLIIAADEFAFVAFGSDETVNVALSLANEIADDIGHTKTVWFHDGQELDINSIVSGLLDDEDWWLERTVIATDETSLTEGQKIFNTNLVPICRIQVNEDVLYIYLYEDEEGAARFTDVFEGSVASGTAVGIAVRADGTNDVISSEKTE